MKKLAINISPLTTYSWPRSRFTQDQSNTEIENFVLNKLLSILNRYKKIIDIKIPYDILQYSLNCPGVVVTVYAEMFASLIFAVFADDQLTTKFST